MWDQSQCNKKKQKDTPKLHVSRGTINFSLSSSKGYGFPSQASAFHISSRAAASTLSSLLLSPSHELFQMESHPGPGSRTAACCWGMTMGNTAEAVTIASMSKPFHSSDQSKDLGFIALLTWKSELSSTSSMLYVRNWSFELKYCLYWSWTVWVAQLINCSSSTWCEHSYMV